VYHVTLITLNKFAVSGCDSDYNKQVTILLVPCNHYFLVVSLACIQYNPALLHTGNHVFLCSVISAFWSFEICYSMFLFCVYHVSLKYKTWFNVFIPKYTFLTRNNDKVQQCSLTALRDIHATILTDCHCRQQW